MKNNWLQQDNIPFSHTHAILVNLSTWHTPPSWGHRSIRDVLSNQKVWCAHLNTGNIATQKNNISVKLKRSSMKKSIPGWKRYSCRNGLGITTHKCSEIFKIEHMVAPFSTSWEYHNYTFHYINFPIHLHYLESCDSPLYISLKISPHHPGFMSYIG